MARDSQTLGHSLEGLAAVICRQEEELEILHGNYQAKGFHALLRTGLDGVERWQSIVGPRWTAEHGTSGDDGDLGATWRLVPIGAPLTSAVSGRSALEQANGG